MSSHSCISYLLSNSPFIKGYNGIYSVPGAKVASEQYIELEHRERVASSHNSNYLETIALHHSIPVMDYEIDRFLYNVPHGGLVLDIGGCWGWHWRRLEEIRPDIEVLIIDFVYTNLLHAKQLLGSLVGSQVTLLQADATDLPLPTNSIDAVWTVQTFQHIPDFPRACTEASRVLKVGGFFVNYSLHATPLNRIVYNLLGKDLIIEGVSDNLFFLRRATERQRLLISNIFGGRVAIRYTECLHHPDLRFTAGGRLGSRIGQFDAWLGEFSWLGFFIARQCSFEVLKKGHLEK